MKKLLILIILLLIPSTLFAFSGSALFQMASGITTNTTITSQPVAGTSDASLEYGSGSWNFFSTSYSAHSIGYVDATEYKMGGGIRFPNITIAQGKTIISATIQFVSRAATSGTTVKSYLTGELSTDAAVFSTQADYQNRRGTACGGANNNYRTTAQVAWDSIGTFDSAGVAGAAEKSPDITSIIQEIVNQPGWVSGHAIVIWWDDCDDRSTHSANVYRQARTYDTSPTGPAVITITYTP